MGIKLYTHCRIVRQLTGLLLSNLCKIIVKKLIWKFIDTFPNRVLNFLNIFTENGGAPVAQWVKRWPTDLGDRGRSPLEAVNGVPRARVGRPQTSSSPPVIVLLAVPRRLFWFFGGFRCGVPLFIVMLVIY